MSNAALRTESATLASSVSQQKLLLDEMQTQLQTISTRRNSILLPVANVPLETMSLIFQHKVVLHETEARLQNVQARLDSIVYPVLNLPPEITAEIFLCCLPEKRQLDVVDTGEAPLLLTHVCSAWRQIAITTPRLWTTFVVTEADEPLRNLVDIANTWLDRAGECELLVEFHASLTGRSNFAGFVPTLRRHAAQMRSLALHLELIDFQTIDPPLNCVALQSLTIDVLEESELDEPIRCVKMFADVPLLREVSLRGIVSQIPLSSFSLPWDQLTRFTGERFALAECLNALQAMPNLTECAFATFWRTAHEAEHLRLFSHPKIKRFTLYSYESRVGADAFAEELLDLVTFPAVQTVVIDDVYNIENALDSFLSRSVTHLRKLVIHPPRNEPVTRRLLSDPFKALSLTELEIWHPSEDFLSPFLSSLAKDANTLPQLQRLSFTGCEHAHGGEGVDSVMSIAAEPITQRRHLAGCAQLQQFRVVSARHSNRISTWYPDGLRLQYVKLRELGMDIYIGTENESDI